MSGFLDRALGAVVTVGAVVGAGAFMVVVDVGWDAASAVLSGLVRRHGARGQGEAGGGVPAPDIDAHGPGYVDQQIGELELQFTEGTDDEHHNAS